MKGAGCRGQGVGGSGGRMKGAGCGGSGGRG